jgi:hypothetical protein
MRAVLTNLTLLHDGGRMNVTDFINGFLNQTDFKQEIRQDIRHQCKRILRKENVLVYSGFPTFSAIGFIFYLCSCESIWQMHLSDNTVASLVERPSCQNSTHDFCTVFFLESRFSEGSLVAMQYSRGQSKSTFKWRAASAKESNGLFSLSFRPIRSCWMSIYCGCRRVVMLHGAEYKNIILRNLFFCDCPFEHFAKRLKFWWTN